MKIALVTAGVFPSEEEARRKLWIFLRSCEKFGAEPLLYGVGTPTFQGYRRMMMDMQLDFLKTIVNDYSHYVFSDSWDAFLCAPWAEIVEKYQRMGSPPILMSAYIGLGNESDMSKYVGCFDETIPYRYPNRGGIIAEIPAMIEAFERMLAQDGLTGDDCFEYYRGWREGWFRPTLDSECQIFQVSDVNARLVSFEGRDGGNLGKIPSDPHLYNSVTGSFPCILHLSGGYGDPETGKDEALKPWARTLGII